MYRSGLIISRKQGLPWPVALAGTLCDRDCVLVSSHFSDLLVFFNIVMLPFTLSNSLYSVVAAVEDFAVDACADGGCRVEMDMIRSRYAYEHA